MTPYYVDDAVTIYHGDCREWMSAADAVVTDPPYGMRYRTSAKRPQRFKGLAGASKYGKQPPKTFVGDELVRGDDAPFDPGFLLGYTRLVLFGANFYADRLPPSSAWVVWDKRAGMTSNDFADCELIYTNSGGPARVLSHRWMGLVRDSELREPRLHPTQKPIAVMRWLIEHYTEADDTILDPFMGSGTTLVAAKSLNRRAIGIEIEERYCEIAANRCRQEVLGLGDAA